MNKIIEFFKWDWEGEYQQYFYVVEDEDKFIREALHYLNTVTINSEHPWSDCLEDFKPEDKIEGHFLSGYIEHLAEHYYINDDEVKYTLTKTTQTTKTEDIR